MPQETAAAAAQLYDFSQRYLPSTSTSSSSSSRPSTAPGLDEFYRRAVAAGELAAAPDLEAVTFRGPRGGPGGGPAVAPTTGGGRTAAPAPTAGG